jgi:hypothetical protein
MLDVSPHPQDFTELAQHAFADNGYVPSAAELKAAAKSLARLSDPQPCAAKAEADVSFEEMLRSCAGV